MISSRSPDLAVAAALAVDVARRGGAHALSLFRQRSTLVVEKKGAQDLVTRADREVKALVREALLAGLPGSDVLGEEAGGSVDTSRPLWVVDPIDGTSRFVHGIPLCSVSIALVSEGRRAWVSSTTRTTTRCSRRGPAAARA